MFTRYSYLYPILAFLLTWGLFQVFTSPLAPAKASSFDCNNVTEIPQAECEALVALYTATNGDDWNDNSGWLDNNSPCEWHGVTCAGGQVTRLILSSNQLSGEIPPELGSLDNLERLHLYDNQLNGEIPSELGSLNNLQRLWLYRNQLSGEIPSELGNLDNLGTLYLSDNQLSGAIPSELGNLNNLEGLDLMHNQLHGEIPSELGNLANLEWLILYSNQLSGEIPSELGNLNNLYELWLNDNQLSGEIPSELGNLDNLWMLFLSGNELSGAIPPELGSLDNLTGLYLGNNQLSGVPMELGSMANLNWLHLHQNPLSGEMLPGFLTNLTLNEFTFYDTEWCVPAGGSLPDWLATISNLYSSGLICETPNGSLSGLVTTIETEAIAGIQVNLYRPVEFSDWQYLTSTHTSEVGSYQFDNLGQGLGIEYHVRFVDPKHQYVTQYYDGDPNLNLSTAITITTGVPRTDIDAILELPQPPVAVIDPGSGSSTYNPDGTAVIIMPASNPSDIIVTLDASCDDGSDPDEVTLQLSTGQSYPMSQLSDGYRATIPAVNLSHNAAISVEIVCNGDTEETEVGIIVLYAPTGLVTDAHSGQPVAGAAVTLYYVPNWEPRTNPDDKRPNTCQSYHSKEPGEPWDQPAPTHLGIVVNPDVSPVSPPVAYQVANEEGYYGWEVSEGCWYMSVEAEGYKSLVSPVIGAPPQVTDLNLTLMPEHTVYLPIIVE